MTLQPIPHNQNLPANRSDVNPYLDGVDSQDLRPPTYRLVQPTSQANTDGTARAGQFYSPETGAVKERITGVILVVSVQRTYWNKDQLGSPICSSRNGRVADPHVEWAGTECATCPYRDDPCQRGYMAVGLEDGDPQQPFIYRFNSKTSITPMQNFLTTIKTRYGGLPFSFLVTISPVQRTNKMGTFYVPIPRAGEKLPDETIAVYQAWADEYTTRQSWREASDGDGIADGGTRTTIAEPPLDDNEVF